MRRFRGWLAFLILLGCMVGIDQMTWRYANLVRYIGQSESIDAPIDKAMKDSFGNKLKTSDLENRLALAATPEQYYRVVGILHKHLGDLGSSVEQQKLMEETLTRYGEDRDPMVLTAYRFLMKRHSKYNQTDELQEVLTRFRDMAAAAPADYKLLGEVHAAAAKAELVDFDIETLERICRLPDISPEAGLRYLFDLHRYYLARQDQERIDATMARRQAWAAQADLTRAVQDCRQRIEARMKTDPPAAILPELEHALRFFPQYAADFRPTYWKLARYAAQLTPPDTGFLSHLWERLAQQPPLTRTRERQRRWEWFDEIVWGKLPPQDPLAKAWEHEKTAQQFDAVVCDSAHAYLTAGVDPLFMRLREIARAQSPGWDMRPFLEGEYWARSGRQGKPPKPLYTVCRRAKAKIIVDGKLDEPVYGSLKPLPGGWWLVGTSNDSNECKPAGALAPRVTLFYNATHLILAADVPEPDLEALLKPPAGQSKKNRRDRQTRLLRSDGVELLLDMKRQLGSLHAWTAARNGSCAHYILDPGRHQGSYWQNGKVKKSVKIKAPSPPKEGEKAKADDKKEPPPAGLFCAVQVGKKGYSLELQIPLDQLPGDVDLAGRLVNGTVRRVRPIVPGMKSAFPSAENVKVSWTQAGNNHSPHRFYFLQFE